MPECAKHCFTPGPWAVFNSEQIAPAGACLGEPAVAILAVRKKKEQQANARLIASAPEMYAAIEQFLALLDASDDAKEAPGWDYAMGEVEAELERVWRKAKGAQ